MTDRRKRKSAWIAIAMSGLIGWTGFSFAASEDVDTSRLEESIRQARATADYASAVQPAYNLLDALRSRPSPPEWQIEDAERLIATLEQAASLDEDARKELARVDALDPVQREQFESTKSKEACETAAGQLETRRRLLGEEHQETARTLFWRAECLATLGKLPEALAAAERTLEVRRALLGPRHPEVADSLHRIASTTWTMARVEESEAAGREALALRREIFDEPHPAIGVSLNRLGQILDVAGKDDEALLFLDEALAMRRELYGDDHYEVAEALLSIGRIHKQFGDLISTEENYRWAHAINGKVLGREHIRYTWSLSSLGDVLWMQGSPAEAEELFAEALEIQRRTRGEEDFHVSRALHMVALLADQQGRHAEAVEKEREALRIAETILGPDHVQLGRHLEVLGNALRALGDHDGAKAAHTRALAITENSELSSDEVTAAMTPLAVDALVNGDLAEAEALSRRIVENYTRQYGEAHPRSAESHALLGRVLEARGDRDGAIEELERAARSFDEARRRVGPGVHRATFVRTPYDKLAALYLEAERSSLAWPALEKARGRILAEVLIASGHRRLTREERNRSEELRLELVDLESRLRVLQARADGEEGQLAELEPLRGRLLYAAQSWDAFQAELEAKYSLTGSEIFDLPRVQAVLRPDDAVIGWLDTAFGFNDRSISWGYVIRKNGPVRWVKLEPDSATRKAALERLAGLRQALNASPRSAFEEPPGRYADSSRYLWKRRVRPLEAHLKGARRLIVVPSPMMVGLPLEAILDDEERFLGERFAISYTPSATVLAWLRERPREAVEREGLLVGDPPFTEAHARAMEQDVTPPVAALRSTVEPAALRSVLTRNPRARGRLPRLPWSRREVAAVAGLSPGMESLVGSAATEQALSGMARRGELSRYRLLHFATHAIIDREQPSRSAIVLSQLGLTDPFRPDETGRAYDGLIMGHEIAREWKLDADLVTLSACETALGRAVPGEGSVGLAHTFFQVGARSLLLSLWKVDDRATSLLMERFYTNWLARDAQGNLSTSYSKSRALHDAKRWLREYEDDSGRKPYRHPYYWSAFVLMGDPD